MDLCLLAGLKPVGLLAEIMKPDGTMARLDDCAVFAREHDLPLITVEQVANYRKKLQETQVEFVSECYLPIERQGKFLGKFRTQLFKDSHGSEHVVLSQGLEGENAPKPDETILVRVHSECFTGNVLGSIKCDCHHQLDLALETISREKRGAVIYVGGHEGRGIGLASKIKAYALQDSPQHLDTFAANEALGLPRDSRKYDSAVGILRYLGIQKVNLLTNNKHKYAALLPFIADVTSLDGKETEYNREYLKAKKREQALKRSSEALQADVPANPFSPAPIAAATRALASPSSLKSSSLPEHPEEAILKPRDGHVKSIPINVRYMRFRPVSNFLVIDTILSLQLPTPKSLTGLRVGLLKTCWNETLVNSLANQTRDVLIESGVTPSNIVEALVPGSFELPWAAAQLIDAAQIDVVVCFGVLIKGETMHFEYISSSVAQGLMNLQLQKNVPVLDAVLNCLTVEQADARCNEKSQLPLSLAATAIHMGALRRGLLPMYQPVGGSPVSVSVRAPLIQSSVQLVEPNAEVHAVLTPQPCGQ